MKASNVNNFQANFYITFSRHHQQRFLTQTFIHMQMYPQSDEIELEDDTSSLNSNSTAQDLFDGEEEITGGTIQDPQEGSLLDNIQDAKDNVVDTLTSNPSTWSEGQKIGVAIGVAVALLLILVIWCKCCRKKKK